MIPCSFLEMGNTFQHRVFLPFLYRGARSISPSDLKQTLGKRTARWRGFTQQDAHEFLVDLLELVQGEVLEAEVRDRDYRLISRLLLACAGDRLAE